MSPAPHDSRLILWGDDPFALPLAASVSAAIPVNLQAPGIAAFDRCAASDVHNQPLALHTPIIGVEQGSVPYQQTPKLSVS